MNSKLTDPMCDAFFTQQTLERKQAITAVIMELDKAEKKYPTWPTDIIHKASIVQEEAGELTRAALRSVYEHGPKEELEKEAKQTAAAGIRFMLNLNS